MPTYKILHLIGGGEIGGAELHVLELLTNLDRQKFSPALGCLATGPLAELARAHNIPSESFLMNHALDLSVIGPLTKWARQEQIVLIHAHGSRANLIGRLTAKRLGIPCVSTVHSSLAHDYLSPWAARVALILDRLTLPLSSGIIAVSHYIAKEVRQRGGQNVRVIYNGISPLPSVDSALQRLEFRQYWRIPATSIVIGCIARLHPTKGHSYLIEAMEQVHARIPNSHLLLVGNGPLFQDLERTLCAKEIPHTMTGFLAEAYNALPAMDLFVLPSTSEGMGLVLLEAMQASIPIVATSVGGIPEVLRSDLDALLVAPANADALAAACLKLLSAPNFSRSLTESSAKRWQQFSLRTMLGETERFYTETLNRPN